MRVSTSVAHTAIDALNAKLSALSVGYQPIHSKKDIYQSILHRIASDLQTQNKSRRSNEVVGSPSYPKNVIRRQCPLVNAGYAARMAIVSCAIEKFISFQKTYHVNEKDENKGHCDTPKMNVILLGGGMDPLGIWASSLCCDASGEIGEDLFAVHVYDLDCEENCQLKRNAMYGTGILKTTGRVSEKENDDENYNNESNTLFEKGFIKFDSISQIDNSAKSVQNGDDVDKNYFQETTDATENAHYHILSVDLTEMSSVDRALNQKGRIDWDLPTIVISELVLAYLGENAANQIIEFISSSLKHNPNSAFIAYEPMGSVSNKHTSSNIPRGYSTEYCSRFTEKLNRGVHSNDNKPTLFEPLGSSCASIQRRFESHSHGSFQHIISLSASQAISTAECSTCMKNCPEIFDEHAALALHLQSYAFIISYNHRDTLAGKQKDEKGPTMFPIKWIQMDDNLVPGVKFSRIESRTEDEQVRSLFESTYAPFFEKFPAVKKMVKTALKIDLNENQSLNESNLSSSSIGHRYRSEGGEFWVGAVDNEDNERKVVACVGVRSCKRLTLDKNIQESKIKQETFEINRLMVDPSFRIRGIGHHLLKIAQAFCEASSHDSDDAEKVQIMASTPAVMKSANRLYESMGFNLAEERLMGKMSICFYTKNLR